MKQPNESDFLHALFPHVRAEVLRILFCNPQPETYGREAARNTTLALRTIQRELAMLEGIGLLTSRRKPLLIGGYKTTLRLYRANRCHPVFGALCQLVSKGHPRRKFVNRAKGKRPRRRYSIERQKSIAFSRLLRRRGVPGF